MTPFDVTAIFIAGFLSGASMLVPQGHCPVCLTKEDSDVY